MNPKSIIDVLLHIEGIINDLIDSYGSEADGLSDDAIVVISTVQELRFEIERELGV